MLLQNKQVAIVGGGPGGLTLARLLQQENIDVKVYERDLNKNARVQGSPLDLHHESGLAALRKANLLDAFKENFLRKADRKIIMNDQIEIFFDDHNDKLEENFDSEYFRPEIDRGVLRKILLESLQPDTIIWDSHFISMEKHKEGWLLHFKNGNSVYADLVIGADGAKSKIRPYITDIKAFYSGITILEGTIPDTQKSNSRIATLLNGGKIMAYGNAKNIIVGQKGNGDIGFGATFRIHENWITDNGLNYSDKKQVLDWVKSHYEEWDQSWFELLEQTETPFIPRPIYCMPLDQCWNALPNLTMLGDAAHVMPPFAGEGVNVAMLDALELSECLLSQKYSDIKQAISHFEINMRERAATAAKESLENGELMHQKNTLEIMLSFFSAKKA